MTSLTKERHKEISDLSAVWAKELNDPKTTDARIKEISQYVETMHQELDGYDNVLSRGDAALLQLLGY